MATETYTLYLEPENQHVLKTPKDIEKCVASQLTYNDFYWKYMNSNWPVILTDVSNAWHCRINWTLHTKNSGESTQVNSNTAINFNYLKEKIGDCQVPVANCQQKYFNSHAKQDMHFYEYLNFWQAKSNENYINNIQLERNLYLKDWHLKALMPDYQFYQVPKHFASDWLNEKLVKNNQDDYRFVYMGPKNSWTALHADVFGSYSWSTNIIGLKKWFLLPPGEELKLANNFGQLPFSISEESLQRADVNFFEITQGENEAVFVPSGWYHQVHNITDTISVNHNWFNACNIKRIWQNLSKNMQKVIAEIEDCRQMDNFDEHCQLMLRASFGINYMDFLEIIEYIADQRLKSCENGNNKEGNVAEELHSKYLIFDKFTLNDYHTRHDILSIKQIVLDMLNDAIVCKSGNVLYQRCLRLEELTRSF